MANTEMLRRLRLGDLRKLFRFRYGMMLPDDDAGREDLVELLKPVSLDPWPNPRRMMNIARSAAPWMPAEEARQIIDDINRMPERERKPSAKELGQRQRVTNAVREQLKLWTIAPCDMTARQLTDWRKTKDRERSRRRRHEAGAKRRTAYLATSWSKQKPWEQKGISRRTWERRRAAKMKRPKETECKKQQKHAVT